MIRIEIPGNKTLELEYLVLDFNGTLAIDGKLVEGVKGRLNELSSKLSVHVITADTFGTVISELKEIKCHIQVLSNGYQDRQKGIYVNKLGSKRCAAIGNGYNDWKMLRQAALGIATIQAEGASIKTVKYASVVCYSVNQALDLLINTKRLAATLRR